MPYADPEKQKAYFKAYHAERYQRKKEEIRAKNDAWRAANKERVASRVYEWKLENVYGINREEYDAILEAQGGCCAVCFTPEPGGSGSWHVDHDHTTGRVRGLLCLGCNVGLGNFKDSPDHLWAALQYLHNPPANTLLAPSRRETHDDDRDTEVDRHDHQQAREHHKDQRGDRR